MGDENSRILRICFAKEHCAKHELQMVAVSSVVGSWAPLSPGGSNNSSSEIMILLLSKYDRIDPQHSIRESNYGLSFRSYLLLLLI
jgi:hypothetical protein